MRIRKNNTIAMVVASLLILSCEGVTGIVADLPPSPAEELPPFVITRPQCEIIERPYYFDYAGLVFKLLNQSNKIIDKVTVSFLLFDPQTQDSPFIGSNKFLITKWETVFPDENKEIILSLDQFIYIAPKEPYQVDFFYIYEIHYADGSVWKDEYGKYRVRD